MAREYLTPLIQQQIDTLIYGCTHYPHLAPVLRSILPAQVQLVDPAVSLVKATVKELELLGMRNTQPPKPTRFCVSGCPQQFADLSVQWLGFTPAVEATTLPAMEPLTVSNQ